MSEQTSAVQRLAEQWNNTPDYTPTDYDQGRVDQRHDMTMQLLEAIEADRASLVTEEPDWEYGACYQADNGRELLWFSMGSSGFAVREAAEKEVERYADAQIQLCRRRKAGPWTPVQQDDGDA